MLRLISPTGKEPRISDGFGSGLFHAPRGSRKHAGVDYLCDPGQEVIAPITGKLVREARPYSQPFTDADGKTIWYSGCVIETTEVSIKMFYFKPDMSLMGKVVYQGQPIGIAQSIAAKYSDDNRVMLDHIHMQVDWIDPESIRVAR